MGTAARFQGPEPASALIPTWLDEPESEASPQTVDPDAPADDEQVEQTNPAAAPREASQPIPPAGQSNRFTSARRHFNSAAQARDRRALGRAVARYVKSSAGGARGATRKMGSARRSAGRIVGFLGDVSRVGVVEALRNLGLAQLVGQPAETALAALTDVFCPAGGPIDEAIARDAWDEAVLTLAEEGISDITAVSADQWDALLVDFMTNAIEARVFNEIGPEGISLPPDIPAIDRLQQDLHEIIHGAVEDAVGDRLQPEQTISQAEIGRIIDAIYDHAFAYLEALDE